MKILGDIFQTALAIVVFLEDIQSAKQGEFRAACDAKFELSTVFKTVEQLEVLRKDMPKADVTEGADKVEDVV